MNVLVIGSGGREHTLVRGLSRSPRVDEVFCAPGNAGITGLATTIDVKVDDHAGLIEIARKQDIGLTVVGPEAPLCDGIVDKFKEAGLRVFGPTASAARIEGDKAYAKSLMKHAHVPSAAGRVFQQHEAAREYIAARDAGIVVKAAGLAAGKGVFVCKDPADGLLAIERIMVDGAFGDAGSAVVIEELLQGEELSVFALVSGRTILVLETAQDHKPIGEGDTGPNTGGMGAYSPAPAATADIMRTIERDVLVPIVDALRSDDAPYQGLLYAGLMLTAAGPKVLEFNCRFGDPETQAVLMRLDSDLCELLEATVDDRLDQVQVRWNPKPAVCVVMASKGYPGAYETGKVIDGLDAVSQLPDVFVFHAGTKFIDDTLVSSGGRVLGVTALGSDIADARRQAYAAVDQIRFENAYVRRDIAHRAISEHTPGIQTPI